MEPGDIVISKRSNGSDLTYIYQVEFMRDEIIKPIAGSIRVYNRNTEFGTNIKGEDTRPLLFDLDNTELLSRHGQMISLVQSRSSGKTLKALRFLDYHKSVQI